MYSFLTGITATIPVMTAVSPNLVVRKGSSATLTCLGREVLDYDTIVFWKFNGHEIGENNTNKRPSERFLPKRRGRFSLHITNVSEQDAGKYTCVAHVVNLNTPDHAERTINLTLYKSGKLQKLQKISYKLNAIRTVRLTHMFYNYGYTYFNLLYRY